MKKNSASQAQVISLQQQKPTQGSNVGSNAKDPANLMMNIRKDQQNSINSERSLLKSGGPGASVNTTSDKPSPILSTKKQTPVLQGNRLESTGEAIRLPTLNPNKTSIAS